MSFNADKQTLDDLNLLGKFKQNSVFSIFNKVRTDGGEKLLDYMFRHPLSDHNEINQRSMIFQYFEKSGLTFPFEKDSFQTMENYIGSGGNNHIAAVTLDTIRKKLLFSLGLDKEFPSLVKDLQTTILLLKKLYEFALEMERKEGQSPFRESIDLIKNTLSPLRMPWLHDKTGTDKLSLSKIIKYDNQLRHKLREEMSELLKTIYQIDVNIAVAQVAGKRGFSYVHALPAEYNIIEITACRHPGIEKAIANSLQLQKETNVLFLTGANMAGKSTFMKSFGIAMYLGHMGFPVAASSMRFSVRDGIFTSINVPDNLQMGYSHFYAEVRRVKTVAEAVSEGKRLVVIFDELFKGTNVKDAYEATLAVTQAFSEYRNCFFIISTHIIEVGTVLMETCKNIRFAFLPTIMEGTIPRYTYTLEEGITSDRHGMMIIENEKILDLILNTN